MGDENLTDEELKDLRRNYAWTSSKEFFEKFNKELIPKVFDLISNKGSSRDVFLIDKKHVAKVAKSLIGVRQNKTEFDVYVYSTLKEKEWLTPVIDISVDHSVLIVVKAEPFPENENIPDLQLIQDIVLRYELHEPDLEKKENWGVYGSRKRKVLTDFGCTKEMFNNEYGMWIRELEEKKIPAVIELISRNLEEVMSNHHSYNVIEKIKRNISIESIQEQLKWKKIYLVESPTSIIATGAIENLGTKDSPKYCISDFYVSPDLHRHGFGNYLLHFLISELKRRKDVIYVYVASSRNAVEFYKKNGFLQSEIQDDDENEIVWMKLRLM